LYVIDLYGITRLDFATFAGAAGVPVAIAALGVRSSMLSCVHWRLA
jgi:hypothetical protein